MKDQDKAKEQLINELAELRQRIAELEAADTERRRTEEVLQALSSRYEAILTAVPDIIMEVDADKVYTWANQAGFEFFGEDVLGKEAAFYFEGEQDTYGMVQPLFNGDENVIYLESWQRRKDGEKRLLTWWCRVLKDANGNVTGALSTARDITQRKRAEEELRKLNRALRMLSGCNQVLIRTTEEVELLQDICRVITQVGGYRLAWVGFAEQDEEKTVRPVAQVGFEDGYLETVNITWADAERGRGPTGTAIRIGEPAIARYILTDPNFEPWRVEAIKRGYASSIALPLVTDGQTLGALNIYAVEPDAFDAEEVKLLAELANDLTYGIVTLRTRAERKRAEEALRENEERYRDLIESTYDIIQSVAPDGRFALVNRAWLETLGYTEAELPSLNLWKIIHPESLSHCREAFSRVMAGESIRNVQATFVAKDGRAILVEGNVTGRYIGGRLVTTHGFFRDITERKRAEEQILSLATKLKAIARPARQMSALLDLDELTQQVVQSLQEVTGCYNANFFLLKDDGLVLATGRGGYEDGKPPLGYRLSLGQGIIGRVAQTGQPVLVPDVSQDPRYVAWEGLPHTRSELAVPVKRGDEVLGVVDMQAMEPNAFDVVDLEALGVLADQLAVALDNARLYEETRQLAAFNESIVQSMAEGIAVEDTEGVFTFVNPAAAAMLGYAPEELLGQHWTAVTPPDQHPIVHAVSERRMRGEADHYELELVRKDGRRLSALVSSSSRFEEGRFAGTLTVFTDITQRKRAERLLQALDQAALAMERALTPEEIFTALAGEFKKIGFSCSVFLTDESQSRLLIRYVTYEAKVIKVLEKLTGLKIEDLSIPIETTDVYRQVVQERKATFVENVEDVMRQFLPKPLKKLTGQIMRILKIARSIIAPLIVEDEVIGLLSVQSGDLTGEDISAITAFAHQMAAAWRKATLLQDLERSLAEVERAQEELRHSYAQLRRTFEGTIQVLTSAVEMRDPYTAGHQQQVTQLACAIAEEMGLSDERIEGIRMAAVVHDLGKISVPAEILSNPGRLNDLQWGMIKMHPQAGYDILKTVEFPWPVGQIVLQHHERMDGSGYPQGLSGEDILLEARILAVSDVVEAMASHRPYRPARGIDRALEEISQNRGVLYDPEVVDACLKLFTEKGFRFEQETNATI
jgi:PAS domain S-box-containing protein